MPIFEFRCEKCNLIKEELVMINEEEPEVLCDNCEEVMKKLISSSSFNLKGTGFHSPGFSGNKNITQLDDAPTKDKYDEERVIV